MSDRVTWMVCPRCADRAAVGWTGGQPAELDCLSGCRLNGPELRRLLRIAQPMGDRVTKRCDAEVCGQLATESAPGWPGFWVCSEHAAALRAGALPSFVRDHEHGWRRPRLVLPYGPARNRGDAG